MFSRIDRKSKAAQKGGISVLEREAETPRKRRKKGRASSDQHRSSIFKTLGPFLLYILFLVFLAGALLVMDGPPRWPQYGWGELWEKLTGPASAFPWKYMVASVGWVVVLYLALALGAQLAVNLFYLASARRHRGIASPLASRLRRVAGSLTLSPAQRVVEGLLAGLAFFSFATTVAGGHQGSGQPGIGAPANSGGDQEDPYSPALMVGYNGAAQPAQEDYQQVRNEAQAAQLTAQLQPDKAGLVVLNAPLLQPQVESYHVQTTTLEYQVKSGDSLWAIAEHFYGNGHRYMDIFKANLGRAVGGGAHFGQTGLIQPGWVLIIPDVVTEGVPGDQVYPAIAYQTGGPVVSLSEYTVKKGDCLWDIAARELNDPTRWPQIWHLNAGHTMADGRIFNDPNLIQPGWKLLMPGTTATEGQNQTGQPQEKPVGGDGQKTSGQDGGQPGSTTGQPGGSQVQPDPTPQITPVAQPTPQPVNSSATPVSTATSLATLAPVTTGGTAQTNVTGGSIQQPQTGEWPWLMALGLGGAGVLSFGGIKLARALGLRRRSGEIKPRLRLWWQRNREVNRWARHSGLLLESLPEVPTDPRTGEVTGYATTERPLEMLRLKVHGALDADKPTLVLRHLTALFEKEGLPRLMPLSCVEGSTTLAFLFTGNPQELSAYLEADGANDLEDLQEQLNRDEKDQKALGKMVTFHGSEGSRNRMPALDTGSRQQILNEMISGYFGGVAWVEKQRGGLLITLEDIEFNDTFAPLFRQPGPEKATPSTVREVAPFEPDTLNRFDPAEEPLDPYSFYTPGGVYARSEAVQPEDLVEEPDVAVRGVQAEAFSSEVMTGQGEKTREEEYETLPDEMLPSGYLLFPLGATDPEALRSPEPGIPSEPERKHYHLCLDNSGHLLLVAQEGEEEALTVLYSAVLQLAAATQPQELALYLVDRPERLSEERIAELVSGWGCVGEAAVQLADEIESNQRMFQTLTALPQVQGLVAGDERSGVLWRQGLRALVEQAYELLVARRSVAGSNLPRIGLVISDLGAVAALEGEKLAQLLREGPAYGLYVLAAVSYEALVKEVLLPVGLEGAGQAWYVEQTQKLFRSLGVFATGDEEGSEVVWGSSAPTQLEGHGEMWLRVGGKSAVKLWGFGIAEEEVTECAGLLAELYRAKEQAEEMPAREQMEASAGNKYYPVTAADLPESVSEVGDDPDYSIMPGTSEGKARLLATEHSDFELYDPAQAPGLVRELSPNGSNKTAEPDIHLEEKPLKAPKDGVLPFTKDDFPESGHSEAEGSIDKQKLTNRKDPPSKTNPALLQALETPELIPGGDLAPHNNKTVVASNTELNETTLPAPAAELSQSLTPGISELLAKLRWELYRCGLVQPTLSFYVLHGLTITFCLRPAPLNYKPGNQRFAYIFPERVDVLKVYNCMQNLGLSFADLFEQEALVLKDSSLTPLEVDSLLLKLLAEGLNSWEDLVESDWPDKFKLERDYLEQVENWVQNLLLRFAYGAESANLNGRGGNLSLSEMQLLVYLTLNRCGVSRDRINEELGFNEVDEQRFRKTLEARLRRTREGLEAALLPFLKVIFGEWGGDLKALAQTLTFFEDDRRFGQLGLNQQFVWADLWELERLRHEYRSTPTVEGEEKGVGKLEETFRLVEVLATTHQDGQPGSKLRLLGDLGEDERKFGWATLWERREELIEWWYELNFKLGDYYLRQLKAGHPEFLDRALLYYWQCHQVRPELEEPTLALMEIGHVKRDKRIIIQAYQNYERSCLNLEMQPDELVKEEYSRLVKLKRVKKIG